MLILPKDWSLTDALMGQVREVMRALPPRLGLSPRRRSPACQHLQPTARRSSGLIAAQHRLAWLSRSMRSIRIPRSPRPRVFAPALSTHGMAGPIPPTIPLRAIRHANEALHGTLGANILIYPDTIQQYRAAAFRRDRGPCMMARLRSTPGPGLAFLIAACPWGPSPAVQARRCRQRHRLCPQQLHVRPAWSVPSSPAPAAFPEGRSCTVGPISCRVRHRRRHQPPPAHVIGRLPDKAFSTVSRWFKLPRILLNALRG